MTTPLVPSITDEQIAELDELAYCGPSEFPVEAKVIQLLLADREQIISRLRAAERDAGRYRQALTDLDRHNDSPKRYDAYVDDVISAAMQEHND